MGIIKTTGYAEKNYPANIIEFSLDFCDKDIQQEMAIARMQTAFRTMMFKFEGMKLNISEFQLEDISVRQSYDNGKTINQASQKVKFRVPFNIALVNTVFNLVKKYDLQVEISTEFLLEESTEMHNELLSLALMDSRAKAEQIASTCGEKVIGIDTVQDDKYHDAYNESYRISGSINGIELLEHDEIFDKLSPKMITISETVYASWKTE